MITKENSKSCSKVKSKQRRKPLSSKKSYLGTSAKPPAKRISSNKKKGNSDIYLKIEGNNNKLKIINKKSPAAPKNTSGQQGAIHPLSLLTILKKFFEWIISACKG